MTDVTYQRDKQLWILDVEHSSIEHFDWISDSPLYSTE